MFKKGDKVKLDINAEEYETTLKVTANKFGYCDIFEVVNCNSDYTSVVPVGVVTSHSIPVNYMSFYNWRFVLVKETKLPEDLFEL